MKKTFALACIAAVTLIPEVQAADLTFLNGPYEFLDEVVMTFYKPLIWYLILAPLQSTGCTMISAKLIPMLVSDDPLTDEESMVICKEGVKMYWEQFYYGGAIGNQPYDGMSWAWTP